MKKRQITKVDSLLPKVCNSLGISERAHEFAIFNQLEESFGEKFKSVAKPLAVTRKNGRNILVIAVKSSAVSSEIMLCKDALLEIIMKVAREHKTTIHDLTCKVETKIFSDKYSTASGSGNLFEEKALPAFDVALLHNVQLDSNTIKKVNKVTSSLPEEIREKISHIMMMELKMREWKKQNGYPLCQSCQEPVNHPQTLLCPACVAQK